MSSVVRHVAVQNDGDAADDDAGNVGLPHQTRNLSGDIEDRSSSVQKTQRLIAMGSGNCAGHLWQARAPD